MYGHEVGVVSESRTDATRTSSSTQKRGGRKEKGVRGIMTNCVKKNYINHRKQNRSMPTKPSFAGNTGVPARPSGKPSLERRGKRQQRSERTGGTRILAVRSPEAIAPDEPKRGRDVKTTMEGQSRMTFTIGKKKKKKGVFSWWGKESRKSGEKERKTRVERPEWLKQAPEREKFAKKKECTEAVLRYAGEQPTIGQKPGVRIFG